MSDIAIRVENLDKLYRIGQRERYYTLRDSLANLFTASFRCLSGNSQFAIGIRPLRQQPPPLHGIIHDSAFAIPQSAFERAMSDAGDIELLAQRPPLQAKFEIRWKGE
jgi:hypothetical protein